ncbi:MAG: hypothetical protein FWC26_14740 [Fibromonadales bacterium]|nr:hypothetical protein [Fibromonadales bacterium]
MLKAKKAQKDAEEIKASAIDFFLKDIEALKQFVKKMRNDFEQDDLVFALKMFVLSNNKIFDMAEYMKGQSQLADEYVKTQKKKIISPEERRAAFEKWIKDNAASYRKNTVFKQIRDIDKMAKEIVPAIKPLIET